MADLSVAISVIQRVSADIQYYGDGRGLHEDTVGSYILSLEFVFRELIALSTIGVMNYELTQAMATFVVSLKVSCQEDIPEEKLCFPSPS